MYNFVTIIIIIINVANNNIICITIVAADFTFRRMSAYYFTINSHEHRNPEADVKLIVQSGMCEQELVWSVWPRWE